MNPEVLFPFGIRLSTLAVLGLFVLTGFRPGIGWRALLAGAAWLMGFEAIFMLTAIGVAAAPDIQRAASVLALRWPLLLHDAAIWYVPGIAAIILVAKVGPGASRPWMALTAVLYALWLVTGFHANGHTGAFDWRWEAINEATKTAWALAYLWPLFRGSAMKREMQTLVWTQASKLRGRQLLHNE